MALDKPPAILCQISSDGWKSFGNSEAYILNSDFLQQKRNKVE